MGCGSMISFMAAAAEGANNEFCFDCSSASYFSAETIAFLVGFSLVIAVPGFFAGMFVHRLMVGTPLPVRLVIVAGIVLVFWTVLSGFFDGVIFLGSLLAAAASSFDGMRVDAERSSTSFSNE